jgi:hypothetical protein
MSVPPSPASGAAAGAAPAAASAAPAPPSKGIWSGGHPLDDSLIFQVGSTVATAVIGFEMLIKFTAAGERIAGKLPFFVRRMPMYGFASVGCLAYSKFVLPPPPVMKRPNLIHSIMLAEQKADETRAASIASIVAAHEAKAAELKAPEAKAHTAGTK